MLLPVFNHLYFCFNLIDFVISLQTARFHCKIVIIHILQNSEQTYFNECHNSSCLMFSPFKNHVMTDKIFNVKI